MTLSTLDLLIIFIPLLLFMLLGILQRQKAGRSTEEFFLSGRQMPWWLLGISMVATTFSADTPNLVTDIVRKNGIGGNWAWWAFLLTGMLTVFVYAKLWRRSGMLTDLEFYELRYGGKMAAFLRGFRALYLGFFFNVVIMAGVLLAGIKIASIMLGWDAWLTLLVSGLVTLTYSTLGGLRSVILTDLFQFAIAMIGTIGAAIYIIQMPEIGSVEALLSHAEVSGKIDFLPDFSDPDQLWMLFIIPIAVQWWSVWYPGAEPGGGGYIVQRMLAAKNERHALYATLFFNFAHYALRPWPWILIALASLVFFPGLADIQTAFPDIDASIINDDLAYPAMLTFLPKGLIGLVILSLISALLSTLSTHLNWGASYVAHDFYKRFVEPEADQKKLVLIGRLSTLFLMFSAGLIALYLESALSAFNILLQIGAGTGLIFILRWFWWRINTYSEISAMVASFLIALLLELTPLGNELSQGVSLVLGVGLTTLTWVIVTLLTPPEDKEVLWNFLHKVKPHLWGWKSFLTQNQLDPSVVKGKERFGLEISGFFAGVFGIYALLFGTGYTLYGQWLPAIICWLVGIVAMMYIVRILRKMWAS
jgi:SSS family transporter